MSFLNKIRSFVSASKVIETPSVVNRPAKVVEYEIKEVKLIEPAKEVETPKLSQFEELVKKTEMKIAAKQQSIQQIVEETQRIEAYVAETESKAKAEKIRREQESQVLKSLGSTLVGFQKELSQRSAEYEKFSQEQATKVAELNASEFEATQQQDKFTAEFESWLNNI